MTDWPVKTLGDVCEVIAGQSPEGKFYNKEGKGVPFYQGKKDFSERVLGSPTTWTTEVTKLSPDPQEYPFLDRIISFISSKGVSPIPKFKPLASMSL